jgi:hypothetical protein
MFQQVPTPAPAPALNTDSSLVDFLKSTGAASDIGSRSTLAGTYGIKGYTGTADQNTQLLSALKTHAAVPAANAGQAAQIAAAQGSGQTSPLGIPTNIGNILGTTPAPAPGAPIPVSALPKPGSPNNVNDILAAALKGGTVDSTTAGLLSLYGANNKQNDNVNNINDKLTTLMHSLGGEAADTQSALDANGVTDAYAHIKDLNMQAAQLTGQIASFDAETAAGLDGISKNPITAQGAANLQSTYEKNRAITKLAMTAELSGVQALGQAYQGNIDTGMKLAQQSVDLKYQPIQADIDTLKQQLSVAQSALSKSDSTNSTVITQLLNMRQKSLDDDKANDTKLQTIGVQAASGGAPLSLIKAAIASKDPVAAAAQLSAYLKGPTESVSGGSAGSFTTTQLNKGASNAGLSADSFKGLSPDVQNYYVNNKGASAFTTALQDVKSGKASKQDTLDEIINSGLPDTVQSYLTQQVNAVAPTSGGGGIGGALSGAASWFGGALKSLVGL